MLPVFGGQFHALERYREDLQGGGHVTAGQVTYALGQVTYAIGHVTAGPQVRSPMP